MNGSTPTAAFGCQALQLEAVCLRLWELRVPGVRGRTLPPHHCFPRIHRTALGSEGSSQGSRPEHTPTQTPEERKIQVLGWP